MTRDVNVCTGNVFANKLLHEPRNPLAFVHVGLNLILAQMMGKPGRFVFLKVGPARFGGTRE
jgi:hypothetical protein